MAQFNLYIPLLIAAEGGYQNLVNDSGNYNSLGQQVGTNHGISAPVYEQWIGFAPSAYDMQNISQAIALEIYKVWYWNSVKGSEIINQSIANIIVDHAVNAGTGAAGKLVQRVLNDSFGYNLSVDGVIGNLTTVAINSVDPERLHARIKQAREQFYINIGGSFLNVWLNRLSTFVFQKKK